MTAAASILAIIVIGLVAGHFVASVVEKLPHDEPDPDDE